ncbi:hypothetical protein MRX96_024833 [Rhipicephalus microplus]
MCACQAHKIAILFSRSVAIGMKIYREQREPGLKDSEGTEMFTMQVNDLFDVLNAKHPATGIRKNSPKIKLYYLAGYVVKKAEKFSSCGDCKATLLATDDVPSAAILTEMRSFVPGALQLPSKDLTSLLTNVESAIMERTRDNVVFGDMFWCIVKDLTQGHSLAQVGCGVHSEELWHHEVLPGHPHAFYARFLRQHKDTSVQVKVARKRAKLL